MTSLEATEAKMTIPNNLKLVFKAESFKLEAFFNAVSRCFSLHTEDVQEPLWFFGGNSSDGLRVFLMHFGLRSRRFSLNLSCECRDVSLDIGASCEFINVRSSNEVILAEAFPEFLKSNNVSTVCWQKYAVLLASCIA